MLVWCSTCIVCYVRGRPLSTTWCLPPHLAPPQEVYLAGNLLSQFPHELLSLPALHTLDLASNRMTRVGKTLGTLKVRASAEGRI